MSKASPIQSSFNGGEVSPLLHGRTDLAAYPISVAEMLNVVPTIQGAAIKRSGSRHVATTRALGTVRFIPFEPQLTQSYLIEATDQQFRFYTNNGLIVTGGNPYVLATPFLSADLPQLSWHANNDVIYFAGGGRQQQRLSRTGAATFAMAPFALRNGPFKDANTNQTVTVAASQTTGEVQIVASQPIFAGGHVGSFFRVEAQDFAATPAWEPAIKTIAVGDKRRSDGKVYRAAQVAGAGTGAGRTGSIQPTHSQGAEWDGFGAGKDVNDKDWGSVQWEYVNDRYGVVRITAVAGDGRSATATVTRTLPSTGATWRWAHGLFSDAEGWPTAVCVWNERLIFAKGNVVVGSVVGDFDNFDERAANGSTSADSAFRYTLASANPILWMRADLQLIIGTSKTEHAMGPLNNSAAAGPGNLQAPVQSAWGSNVTQPLQIGGKTLFVARGGRKVREAGYSYDSNRYVATDTTVRAEHITRSGVTQMAFQQEPYSLLWAVRNDGTLLSFTYSDEQEVRGWSRHVLGGSAGADRIAPAKVEAVGVIPTPDGTGDQVWLAVRRFIDGEDRRYIERLETFWEFGQKVEDGFFVDCGLTYSGAPASTISGLNHLRGELVAVLADGASHPDCLVTPAGTITLANGGRASKVQVGLGFSARLTTLKLEAGGNNGTAQAQVKKIVKLALRLLDTLGITAGPPGGPVDDVVMRSSADAMDRGLPAFTGDHVMDFPGTFERDGQITVESYQPLPMAILALMPRADTRG